MKFDSAQENLPKKWVLLVTSLVIGSAFFFSLYALFRIMYLLPMESYLRKREDGQMNADNELRKNMDKLHTTPLGAERIKRNLSLDTDDVVAWCKMKTKK